MQPEMDPKLELLIDAELKALPPVKAPATLVPQVLALLASRAQQPWWRQVWWQWPLAAKAAYFLLALAIIGAIGDGGVMLDDGVANYSQQATERLAPVASLWDTLLTLQNAVGLLWVRAAQPLLLYALILGGLLYLACLGLGTACVRYARKRA